MAGNTFGRIFTVTSFGESHGPALGCVVDGCPPGLEISEAELQVDAADISPAALKVCRRNVRRLGLGARVTPVRSD